MGGGFLILDAGLRCNSSLLGMVALYTKIIFPILDMAAFQKGVIWNVRCEHQEYDRKSSLEKSDPTHYLARQADFYSSGYGVIRSLDRELARSLARSFERPIARLLYRTLDSSIARSFAESFDRTRARSLGH